MVSHDQKGHVAPGFDCLLILVPMESHDQKSHVASPFDGVDLMNVMLPLTMLSEPSDASRNGIT